MKTYNYNYNKHVYYKINSNLVNIWQYGIYEDTPGTTYWCTYIFISY